MDILGDVNNGWFAQLAGAGEWLGRQVGLGTVYDHMETAANTHMQNVSNQAQATALANGATPVQALQQANGALNSYANPQGLGDLGKLFGTGAQVAYEGTSNAIAKATAPDYSGLLTILAGAGVVGGVYLLADNMSSSPKAPPSTPRAPRAPARAH